MIDTDTVNTLFSLMVQYFFAVVTPLAGVVISILIIRRVSGV